MHKARIKLENAVYLPLNTTCWIFKTIMYVKSLTQNYLYIYKPETGAAFQPKPKFSAEHLSNFISNHLNVHKCDGTKMKSVCPFCCFYVLTCEFNIYRHRYKTGRLICQIGQKFIQIHPHSLDSTNISVSFFIFKIKNNRFLFNLLKSNRRKINIWHYFLKKGCIYWYILFCNAPLMPITLISWLNPVLACCAYLKRYKQAKHTGEIGAICYK